MESCKTKIRRIIYLDFEKNIYKVFEDDRNRDVAIEGDFKKHKKDGWQIIKKIQHIECGKLNPTDTIDRFYDIVTELDLNREYCSVFTWFKDEEQFFSKIS